MTRRIAALLSVAGLVQFANAAVNTRLDFLVSANGSPYQPTVDLPFNAGLIHVEVVARLTYIGPGTAQGLASAVFQPTVSHFAATDLALGYVNSGMGSNTSTPPGVVSDAQGNFGRISPYGRTALTTTTQAIFNHIHNGGSAGAPLGRWLRIAQRAATGWIGTTGNTTGGSGVPIAQLANVGRTASDPAFAFGTTVNVFRWGMEIDTSVTGRQLVIDVPANGWGNRVLTFNSQFPDSQVGDREVYWWGDMNATTGDLRGTAIVTQGFINLIPSPGTCGLLAFGLAAASRRRR